MKLDKYLKRYLTEDNEVIGIQFQSDWLPIMLRYQTDITIEGDNIYLMANPNIEQQTSLDNFISMLNEFGYGELISKRKVADKKLGALNTGSQTNAVFNPASIYQFRVFIGADDTETKKVNTTFSIKTSKGSINYRLIEVGVANNLFKGCLRLLLKEKTSDGLTFFTDILKEPISPKDTQRLLYVFAGKNVTGLGLMGARIKAGKVETGLYPITSDISMGLKNGIYNVQTDTGNIMFHSKDIKGSEVEKVGVRSYIFRVKLGKDSVEILFGI